MHPAAADPWHAEELWHGLGAGRVHTVATDHCPFWMHDRRAGTAAGPSGWADFTEIPGGLPGIETRLALIWDGVARRAPHRRGLGAAVRRGAGPDLRAVAGQGLPGAWAPTPTWWCGIPTRAQSLSAAALHMRTDHSPYEGTTVTGWPALVLSAGPGGGPRRRLRG